MVLCSHYNHRISHLKFSAHHLDMHTFSAHLCIHAHRLLVQYGYDLGGAEWTRRIYVADLGSDRDLLLLLLTNAANSVSYMIISACPYYLLSIVSFCRFYK